MKKHLLTIALLLIVNFSFSQVAAAERDALIAIYNSTNGTSWTTNTNWNTTNPVSTWYGITVVNISGQDYVTEINLPNNNLSGNIPSEIENIPKLKILFLANNNLSGIIPIELGNLSELEQIVFWNNNLSGNIPSEIGNCANLKILSLEENQLTGSVPNSLANLTLLRSFWVNDNQLSGDISNIVLNWVDLFWFSIGDDYNTPPYNNFTGTLDFSNSIDMYYCIVSHNNFTTINIQNGNNLNTTFNATNNPSLTCVFVDDATYSSANWMQIDATATFLETQAECNTLSSAAFNDNVFTIYPNPVDNILRIDNTYNKEILKIEIYSTTGKMIKQVNEYNDFINIENLASGMYILKLHTSDQVFNNKFIKK